MEDKKVELNCLKCQYRHQDNGNCTAVGGFCTSVPAAYCPLIPELLARAEAAEAQLRKVRQILSDPLIVCGENNTLRPVKRTSKQDVYTTVLKAQKVVGVVGRWFPKEWEET